MRLRRETDIQKRCDHYNKEEGLTYFLRRVVRRSRK
jgi:hypothetical protein